jgi:hypothetical protein
MSSQFNNSKIRNKNLSDKCLVYISGNTVEYDFNQTPELPKKALKKLRERLEDAVGDYNQFYMKYKKNLIKEDQYEVEVCQAKFDYWGIRDAFVEFFQTITNKYTESIIVKEYNDHL